MGRQHEGDGGGGQRQDDEDEADELAHMQDVAPAGEERGDQHQPDQPVAPGAEEDQKGEPFVGRAGQLLDAMLSSIHLSRDKVYIANILKCRPPNNRDPKPKESLTCGPYLERQISLLQPKVILALGRIAAQWLLKSDSPIGRLRGGDFNYGERQIPLVVSYHPAYLLRSPSAKSKAWEDLVLVMQVLQNS